MVELHGKSAWTLHGAGAFIKSLEDRVSPEKKREALEAAAEVVRAEAVVLAPRETGLLESEVEVVPVDEDTIGVGVRKDSPAYERAVATEYGTATIAVGSPTAPRTSWPAKSKAGASMPWLRPAILRKKREAYAAMRHAIFNDR